LIASLAATSLATACTLEKSDDVSEYREALPQAAHVQVAGPEQSGAGSRSMSASAETGLLADGAGTASGSAEWYRFTRNIRDGVNAVTAGVLGSVWFVVHTKPSTIGDGYAVWGPYTDALDPVTWRLRVDRVDEHEYEYRLDGRPRDSRSEDDYLTVLHGKGYGRADDRHGDGSFSVDLDASRTLDPDRAKPDDSGTVTITHDLPPYARRKLGALPREIRAELEPAGDAWLDITSYAYEDGTGRLEVAALGDVDEAKTTALEDIAILSRWRADGAGRADVSIAGGDVPEAFGSFSIAECWADDFARVYYTDSVGAEPTQGDETACAFTAE
jgi:hypothetical protein